MPPKKTVIPLAQLQPGMVLPAEVFDGLRPSLLLLACGTMLTVAQLDRLRARGIKSIAIDSRFADSLLRPSTTTGRVAEPTAPPRSLKPVVPRPNSAASPVLERVTRSRDAAYDVAQQRSFESADAIDQERIATLYREIHLDQSGDGAVVQHVAKGSVDRMLTDLDLFVRTAIAPHDSQADFEHCVHVSQLAMSMAAVSGLTEKEVAEIGMGCLVSRIGMTERARQVASQERDLNSLELLEIRRSPGRAYDVIEKMRALPLGARQVAYQIHERFNGSGYPRGKVGQRIHKLARIAAVADVYIALITARPHRPARQPYEAVTEMLGDARKGLFDPEAIRSLLQTVGLFPLGSRVELSDGAIGEIVRTTPEQFDRPVVRIEWDASGEPVAGVSVDLKLQKHLRVVRVVDPDMLEDRLEAARAMAALQDPPWFEESSELSGHPGTRPAGNDTRPQALPMSSSS